MTERSETSEESHGARRFVVFHGVTRIADGDLAEAASAAKHAMLRDPAAPVIVFDRATGEVADLDMRGGEPKVVPRHAPAAPSVPTRGRPKLGVVAREVTLLPRHWEWLSRQPGGASVALRRLVESARKADGGATRSRERTEAAYRFISAIGGNLPRFENVARALFSNDWDGLAAAISQWPPDVRDEALGFLKDDL